jgi:hypothetical protein
VDREDNAHAVERIGAPARVTPGLPPSLAREPLPTYIFCTDIGAWWVLTLEGRRSRGDRKIMHTMFTERHFALCQIKKEARA